MRRHAGRPAAAALFLTLFLPPSLTALQACPAYAEPVLQVSSAEGQSLGTLPMPQGAEICLSWEHSVTGGPVSDCFENRGGTLVLTRSYLHDFAAGLGEVPGRGTLVSAKGGGYWIVGIDEAMPDDGLPLRVGSREVGHVLRRGDASLHLSRIATGQRVTLILLPDD